MKIEDSSQKMAVMQQMNARPEKAEANNAQAQSDSAAKAHPAGDRVKLSGMVPMSAEMRSQEAQRAQHVEAIKAQVAAGTYQVDSRDVAQKMLTKLSSRVTVH